MELKQTHAPHYYQLLLVTTIMLPIPLLYVDTLIALSLKPLASSCTFTWNAPLNKPEIYIDDESNVELLSSSVGQRVLLYLHWVNNCTASRNKRIHISCMCHGVYLWEWGSNINLKDSKTILMWPYTVFKVCRGVGEIGVTEIGGLSGRATKHQFWKWQLHYCYHPLITSQVISVRNEQALTETNKHNTNLCSPTECHPPWHEWGEWKVSGEVGVERIIGKEMEERTKDKIIHQTISWKGWQCKVTRQISQLMRVRGKEEGGKE